MQRALWLSLLLALCGCAMFKDEMFKDDTTSRLQALRRSLDYPVVQAGFATDGTPVKIVFTDIQVAPEVDTDKWIAFSSSSLGNDNYRITEQTVVNLNSLRGHLRWLSMVGIKMSPKTVWTQLDITGVEHLELAATNVDDSNSMFLKSGEDLTFLDLSGTSVGDASLVHIMCHRNLRHVCLNGTNVTDEGLTRLAAIRSLKVIELIGTRATDVGVDSYRAAGGEGTVVLDRSVGGVF